MNIHEKTKFRSASNRYIFANGHDRVKFRIKNFRIDRPSKFESSLICYYIDSGFRTKIKFKIVPTDFGYDVQPGRRQCLSPSGLRSSGPRFLLAAGREGRFLMEFEVKVVK